MSTRIKKMNYRKANIEKSELQNLPMQSLGEEIASSVTHGIGAALSIAALVLLVVFASKHGETWRIASLSIYGATLVFLYLTSTLYHSFPGGKAKRFFRLLDHISIYLLIAGSYTPVVLLVLQGQWGWTLFGLIWTLAIGGILAKIFLIGKLEIISVLFYIAMGWIIVIAFKPFLQVVPTGLIAWLFAGGLFYTLGTIFYAWKRLPHNHTIWHLFVLAGSAAHFFGIFFYLTEMSN